jgi:hypothetical protein
MAPPSTPPPPTKAQKSDMTVTGRKDFFDKLQELFNEPEKNNFVEMVPNTEKNPKFYDINLKINGQNTRHLCKIIVTDSTKMVPFSMGDVLMSTEISNEAVISNISFSLIHQKVADIPYLKGLFDQYGRLHKRTQWYEGYYTKSNEVAGTSAPVPPGDKVTQLENEIARMKPFYEYGLKVKRIEQPVE